MVFIGKGGSGAGKNYLNSTYVIRVNITESKDSDFQSTKKQGNVYYLDGLKIRTRPHQ